MFRWSSLIFCLFAVSQARAEWSLTNFREVAQLPAHAVAWEADVRQGDREVRVTGVSFDAKEAVFRVIDNPPDTRQSLADALAEAGSFAGSNGNYFKEDYTPVGLQISAGKPIHGYEKANLLSGILAVRGGELEMLRPADYRGEAKVTEALQCGPWLVEKGAPIPGLNALRFARRTVVATDGKGHWALIAISPVTLAEAGSLLLAKDLPGAWTIHQALNFDGGPSTTLVALSDSRPVLDIPSFGPVRNYLAISPRPR